MTELIQFCNQKNNISNIIQWCNDNEGFATIALSALTLLVSIIAIIVSIRTSRLPYKKKILINTGSAISTDGIGAFVEGINVGNRNVRIKTIGFSVKKHNIINTNTLFESQVILNQGDTTTQYFAINDLKNLLVKNNVSKNSIVKAIIIDSEGKIYKKRLTSVKRILNLR